MSVTERRIPGVDFFDAKKDAAALPGSLLLIPGEDLRLQQAEVSGSGRCFGPVLDVEFAEDVI